MAQLEHITPEQIAEYGVVAAPDRLVGKAQDNKAIFDRLVRELVAVVVNSIIDKTNELLTAEDVREENEKNRVAAELLRVEAENLRVQAESARVNAEEERVQAEAARVSAELLRVQAENLRVQAEQGRVTAEQGRVSAEQAREQAEKNREDATNGIVAQSTVQADRAKSEADRAEQAAGNAAADAVTAVENKLNSYVSDAESGAKKSESWAVGGTGTRPGEDTNNAKYWAGVAQGAACGVVITFNGRSGAVTPQKGDYTAEMVGARPDNWMPTAQEVGARPDNWTPTAQDVGADPSGSAAAVQKNLDTHAGNKNNPHGVTASQVGAAPTQHNHNASAITEGTLPIARGGTGVSTMTGTDYGTYRPRGIVLQATEPDSVPNGCIVGVYE